MNFVNPFETQGNWYIGNLHTHTTNSDGQLSPEDTCRFYRKAGYDFLCITDHNVITEAEEMDGLTIFRGAEMNNGLHHIVGVNMQEEFPLHGLTTQQIIDAINLQGAISIIAHPYWSALTGRDLLSLHGYMGIEVYNHLCNNVFGKGFSTAQLDELLAAGKNTLCFASDDTHSTQDLTYSSIIVKSPSREKTALLEAIRSGCFYASTGPIVKGLQIGQSGTVGVKFSPATTVDFISATPAGLRIAAKSGEIEYAEYEIKGTEKYLRIEITDRNNRKAWINPVLF